MYALITRFIKVICLLVIIASCQCSTSRIQKQVWIRGVQITNNAEPKNVVRIYLDKFGYFYPKLEVPIDKNLFFDDDHGNLAATDTTIANVYHYFKAHPTEMSLLRNIYKVSDQKTFNAQYYDVQEKILEEYYLQLRDLIENRHAENIVFIIHGFNDENPIRSYQLLEENIRSDTYGKKAKPVFVEIYWDGLTAQGKSPMLAKIWGRAQNNTKYVSLGMRTLLNNLPFKLPITIITHSLGASVGTGALFNTTSKWRLYDDPDLNGELERLLKAPTRRDVRIRLGMLAPAIPGGNTFVDFNRRSPYITPAENNIDRIVIGYNPYDFATSKAILSGHLGTTTLGCNQGNKDVNKGEIPILKDRLYDLGYSRSQTSAMVKPIMFITEKWKLGLQEHGLEYYLKDKTSTQQFIRVLFE